MCKREGPASCGAFPASIQPPYFMCCHADSAVYNASHACRQACDDSAEYNGVSRVVAC
jgi:hypothetical protein